mgnify:FL=1
MHTAQALVDAWCETDMRDRDKTLPQVLDTNSTGKLANGLSLSLVPFAAAAAADTRTHTRTQGGHRQGQDEGTRRREAAVRLKHVLKAQFELENYRAQKVTKTASYRSLKLFPYRYIILFCFLCRLFKLFSFCGILLCASRG